MRPGGTYPETWDSPALNAYEVSLHDSNEIGNYVPKGIYVGQAGDIAMVMYGNSAEVTLKAVPAGTFLPICPKIIKAAGTSAASIVAFF